jgi:ribosomal protein S20
MRFHKSSNWFEEERQIALDIVKYANDKSLISPNEADELEKKINSSGDFLAGDLGKRVEILAQSIDFKSRVQTITDSFQGIKMPESKLNATINKFHQAAQNGDLKTTTETLVELDLEIKHYAQCHNYIELKKSATPAIPLIAPPPPKEREVFSLPPPNDLAPLPIGMEPRPPQKDQLLLHRLLKSDLSKKAK